MAEHVDAEEIAQGIDALARGTLEFIAELNTVEHPVLAELQPMMAAYVRVHEKDAANVRKLGAQLAEARAERDRANAAGAGVLLRAAELERERDEAQAALARERGTLEAGRRQWEDAVAILRALVHSNCIVGEADQEVLDRAQDYVAGLEAHHDEGEEASDAT